MCNFFQSLRYPTSEVTLYVIPSHKKINFVLIFMMISNVPVIRRFITSINSILILPNSAVIMIDVIIIIIVLAILQLLTKFMYHLKICSHSIG